MTTGEISAHFAQTYGASASNETISRKVRDGQVANRPIYAASGVTLSGEKDVLWLRAGTGDEGAKF